MGEGAVLLHAGLQRHADRTVETWRNLWFHTGDTGRMDARGFIWYIDRIKGTIRRRGENISSYKVEAVLRNIPMWPRSRPWR